MTPDYGPLRQSHTPGIGGLAVIVLVGFGLGGLVAVSGPVLAGWLLISPPTNLGTALVVLSVLWCLLSPVAGWYLIQMGRRDLRERLDLYETGLVGCYGGGHWGCAYTDLREVEAWLVNGSVTSITFHFHSGGRRTIRPNVRDAADAVEFIRRRLTPPDPLLANLPRFPGA